MARALARYQRAKRAHAARSGAGSAAGDQEDGSVIGGPFCRQQVAGRRLTAGWTAPSTTPVSKARWDAAARPSVRSKIGPTRLAAPNAKEHTEVNLDNRK